jgi:hypothetical protein
MYQPTAIHALVEVHETPGKRSSVLPAGRGVDSIAHLVPFQTSLMATNVTLRM